MTDDNEKRFREFAEVWANDHYSYRLEEYRRTAGLCDPRSPLERLLLAAMFWSEALYNNTSEIWVEPSEDWVFQGRGSNVSKHIGVRQTLVVPQAKILNYVVDFAVVQSREDKGPFVVLVECDGHDFHEKTKEQAAHRAKRDRELQGLGYRVLHFTGSEIYRDPMSSVEQIAENLEDLFYQDMDAAIAHHIAQAGLGGQS